MTRDPQKKSIKQTSNRSWAPQTESRETHRNKKTPRNMKRDLEI